MTNYYHQHEGNLHPGDIAKAEDINQIQQNIQDALRDMIEDFHERQGCILGQDEYAFLLTPETKRAGRFIDQMNLAEDKDGEFISIRETDYRQPIKLSRSSLYSVIVKLQNKSEKDVPVVFELHDANENLIEGKRVTLKLPAKTEPQEFEIVFDLEYYPTAHGHDPQDLEVNDPRLVIPDSDKQEDTEGIDYGDENTMDSSSLGASEIYFVVKALNKNKFNVNQTENGYTWNDTDPTFGILMNINSNYGQLLEENNGSGFVLASKPGDLYFKEVYANSQTYHCQQGEALIGGEKVFLADTHVNVSGADAYGNVVSYIYMDVDGHLHSLNSKIFTGSEPNPEDIEVPDVPHLHIANIYTYADDRDPVIDQDDTNQITRPRSHHERLRRLEKQMKWTQDIAIPPRLKYTLTGDSWIDTSPEINLTSNKFDKTAANNLDALQKDGYVITTDANGNFIIKVTKAEVFNIPITLKSDKSGVVVTSDKKTKVLKSAQTSAYINTLQKDDIARAQVFAEIKNMNIDISNGTMQLNSKASSGKVATTKKEAETTDFNPWDDFAKNRPKSSKIKPTTRSYTVTSGKNGKHDWASEFPAMTFYTSTDYNLKKLEIPIYKFKNCTGIKFLIYKRQQTNNQTNTVWLGKRIKVTNVFSLKKAKIKNGYQYMEDGFLLDFGKKGLTLEKGQYVIIALPIVSSGKGTVYVDTYKPESSRDFCIRYYGAANASHFLLKTRYHEIWYNPVKASGEVLSYDSEGSITSGVVTWENKEPIQTIKPTANITQPKKGTSFKLEVNTGGSWQELELNKANTISGGQDSFKWRLTFKGNKKETPILKYDKKKKYALNFEITRASPHTGNMNTAAALDKNLCFTSIPFNANNILRDYIGDMNFALYDNKFSNFEFGRIWGSDDTGKELVIDISASDRVEQVAANTFYTVYSLYYVDLHLNDFNSGSVDYSNYDPQMEIDEHNLRFKLDTEHSYNDNDIQLLNINEFKPTSNDIELSNTTNESTNDQAEESNQDTEGVGIDLTKITASENNQTILKATLGKRLNLAAYDSIKVGFKLNGSIGGTVSGIGVYISSAIETETPSNIKNEPSEEVILVDQLPDLNASQEDTINLYANSIIKRFEPRNGSAGYVYYQSRWDSANQKWVWELLKNIKSYEIYEIVDKVSKSDKLTITEANQNATQYIEIEIDPDKVNLQYAQEIGIILLNDENKYVATNVTSIVLTEFTAIQHDYYPVFNAKDGDVFVKQTPTADAITTTHASGSLVIKPNDSTTYNETSPKTSQIVIGYKNIASSGETIATFSAKSKSTKNFNHIGIQLAADCFIVKNMLEIHLRKYDEDGVMTVVDKINLPTTNYVYYPTASEKSINLVQIFKKLDTTERFDEIALVATSNFKNYMEKLRTINGNEQKGCDNNYSLSLFIGNIVLYQAKTIPIFHPTMRMKFYLDGVNEVTRKLIGIRKIGAVLDYQ